MCGYRFKDNEEICPECFTAREEDISCHQYSESVHTHGRGFSTTEESDIYDEFKEDSFIDEQRKEEASDPIPSATYNKNAYSNANQNNSSYVNLRNNYRQTGPFPENNSYHGNTFGQSRPLNYNAYRNGSVPNVNRNSSKAGGAILVAVLLTIIVPVIMFAFVSASTKNSSSKNTNSRVLANYSQPPITITKPPQIKVPDLFKEKVATYDKYDLHFGNSRRYKTFYLKHADGVFTSDELASFKPEGNSVLGEKILGFDVTLDIKQAGDYWIYPMESYVEACDITGKVLSRSYIFNSTDKSVTSSDNNLVIVPAQAVLFKAHFAVFDNGQTKDLAFDVGFGEYQTVNDTFGYDKLDESLADDPKARNDDTSSIPIDNKSDS